MICARFRWSTPTNYYHRFTTHLGRKWDGILGGSCSMLSGNFRKIPADFSIELLGIIIVFP